MLTKSNHPRSHRLPTLRHVSTQLTPCCAAVGVKSLGRARRSPSGASWSADTGTRDIQYELDTWDFGFSAGRRLSGNLWLEGEVGVTGLTGMSLRGSNWEEPEFGVSNSPYVSIGLNFRPSL